MRLYELLEAPGDENRDPTLADRVVALYPGRFHPFHPGHYSVYKNLVAKFGAENVLILTSNKNDDALIQKTQEQIDKYLVRVAKYNDALAKAQEKGTKEPAPIKAVPKIPEKFESPFNFDQKKLIMMTMYGIPGDKIHQVRQTYSAHSEDWFRSEFDKDVAVVYAVSQKDAERLTFDHYDPRETLLGYQDTEYQMILPEFKMDVAGGNVSGTQVRKVLGDVETQDDAKELMFKKSFGLPLDKPLSGNQQKVFQMIKNKLGENRRAIDHLYRQMEK